MFAATFLVLLTLLTSGYCHIKLDTIGQTFKKNVDEVKSWPQIDLVFLVDASSSVGQENFLSELRFVRKLLSDLTVSNEHTQLAVITFGSQDTVITHIDGITTETELDKCTLLNTLLPNINYTGGGTYTLGAVQRAKNILINSARNNTRKAIFLITDGFSNGGDPVPVATELKDNLNVTIFCIGIKTGRSEELKDLSSSNETCYLLNGFREFESLARRALHADLQDGEYVPVQPDKCGGLCDADRAECTCGIGSGQYACRCRRGYYGTGQQCLFCPKGTWHRARDGFCVPCSDPNHISYHALSQEECICKPGYQDNGFGRCEVVQCPLLEAPSNGYFVGVPARDECPNVLHNACGVRCQVGYSLRGNSIRLCQENGTWTGIQPQCELKTCSKPSAPTQGEVLHCVNKELDTRYEGTNIPDIMPVDTECTFECKKGHSITGSMSRTCLPIAQWDGLRTACRPIRCNRLGKIAHGHWEPENCSKERQPFGTQCTLTCKPGFTVKGEALTCRSTTGRGGGKWIGTGNKCVDIEPPTIQCPSEYITVETEPGTQYGIAEWTNPQVKDNSGSDITVWTEIAEEENHPWNAFEIGTTVITYYAVDAAGNEASCNMTVEVIDKEPPVIENCESPPPFLTSDPANVRIEWEEPLAYDNSQGPIEITKSHEFGLFLAGTTEVLYSATDSYNNTSNCSINITVITEASCETPPTGAAVCSPTPEGVTCALTCQEGYGFALTDKAICLHETPGMWDIPECTPTESPTQIWQVVNAETECSDNETVQTLGSLVKQDGGVVLLTGCERTRRDIKEQKRLRRLEFHVKNTAKLMEVSKQLNINVTIGKPIINCKNGSVPAVRQQSQKPRCVLCPKGTYYLTNRCISCPPNTYANKPGATACTPCPVKRSTMGKKRVKSKRGCKAQCPTGTDKSQKGITCESRPIKRKACERPTVCENGGQCVPVGRFRQKCICANGWFGARCRIKARLCNCENGGTCVEDENKCICAVGFTGDACQIQEFEMETDVEPKPEPTTNPCLLIDGLCENNSTCVEKEFSKYICKCANGYIGKRCNILPCDYNPCPGNTVCTNVIQPNTTKDSYTCECTTGKRNPPECDTPVDVCESNPCQNGGACISVSRDIYSCNCSELFYGFNCELQKDPDYILYFPRSGINDFVIVDGPASNLSEVSMCVWLQTADKGNYGTVLSYATISQDNAFTVTDYSGLVLYVNGRHVVTDVRLNDGRWHHLCVTWNMSRGLYNVYVDSKLEISGQGLSDGTHISGNGKIVLGQEQDTLGGRFSRAESFIGKLSYVDIWNKALTKNEIISTMRECTSTLYGNVRTWADFRNGTRGFVHIENSTFCANCTAPLPIINGKYKIVNDGRTAVYTCDVGYILIFEGKTVQEGILKRECTVASQWEGFEDPKCEPVSCFYPGYVPYAIVSGISHNYRFKDKLIYQCIPGYEPQQTQIRTCNENGTWTGTKPVCRGGQCESFPKPHNANITIISEYVYDDEFDYIVLFEIGTKLDVSCVNETVLVGEKYLVCQENGTWNHATPICKTAGCVANEMPAIPPNGYTLNDITGVLFDVGTTVSFKCRNGHILSGNNYTECLADGKWSDPNITCNPIQCIQPPAYENMSYKNGYNITKYYFGNMLKYECNEGYEFFGNSVIRCLANGKWTRIKGQCTRISCNKPKIAADEVIIGNSYLYKDSLSILCPKGSKSDEYTMTCTSAGKWLQVGDCTSPRHN